MDHMYIRHAVGGRLFYDSAKHGPFELNQQKNGSWLFTIGPVDPTVAEELLAYRDELNIFLVPAGAANGKSWFYTTHGQVQYDASTHRVTVLADVRHDYTV